MGRLPQPVRVWEDLYRPTRPDFYYSSEYAGFRSLLALMSLTAEINGLATFHLSHPIREQAPWRNEGDRHRFLFQCRIDPYLKDRRELLERDWLPRSENLTVQAETEAQADLFLPLRLAGYRLRLGPPKGAEEKHKNMAIIREDGADPSEVTGRGGVVISPGQLPGSWQYLAEPENDEPLTPEEKLAARALVKNLDLPESRELGWAELIFRRYSFFEDGALKQFCFRGQRLLTAERSPRLTPRAYALGRFGIMPKSQWQTFVGQGILDDYHPDFRRWEPLARRLLKIEYKLLNRILPDQSKKWFKYRRDRAAFFIESSSRFSRLYHLIWRRLFRA